MPSTELALGLARGITQRRRELRQEARQDEQDKRAADRAAQETEARDYEKTQRPMRERATAATVESAERGNEQHRIALEEASRQLRDEGFLDLIDALDGGAPLPVALRTYNARGTNRIDPSTASFDPNTKILKFVDPKQGEVEATTDQFRAVLAPALQGGKTKPDMVPYGGTALDPVTHKPIYQDTRRTSGGRAAPRPSAVRSDQALIGPDGKPIYKGPDFGKPKPGKGAGTLTKGGQKVSTFNQQTYMRDIRKTLSARVGLEIDPKTQEYVGKKPGDSERWLLMSSVAERLARKYQGQIGPAEISDLVHTAYAAVKSTEELGDVARKAKPMGRAERGDDYQTKVSATARQMQKVQIDEAEKFLTELQVPVDKELADAQAEDEADQQDQEDAQDEPATGEPPAPAAPQLTKAISDRLKKLKPGLGVYDRSTGITWVMKDGRPVALRARAQ